MRAEWKEARGEQEEGRRPKGSEKVEGREESKEGLEGWSVGGFWVVGWVSREQVLEGASLAPASPKYLTWFVAHFRLSVFCVKIEL